MGRPGRTLLIIGAMAIVCVVALMGMANRYNKVLAQRSQQRASASAQAAPAGSIATFTPPPPPAQHDASAKRPPEEEAAAFVDAFLDVRAELRAALDAAAGASGAERLALLDRVRDRALEAHDLDLAEYRQVRTLWRGWRATGTAPTRPFQLAFAARPNRVAAADLGEMEAYD